MATFLPARGCIYTVGNGGVGAYAVQGLNSADLIITGAPFTDKDAINPVNGLRGAKVIYNFGTGFGNVTINGLVLLGPVGSLSSSVSRLQSFFEANRISSSQAAVNLSVPGGGYRVYLHGYGLGAPDPEYHLQPFAFSGMIARPR